MNVYAIGIAGTFMAIQAVAAADSLLSRTPLYRVPRDVILDKVLGPAESIEYTGSTTPSVAP